MSSALRVAFTGASSFLGQNLIGLLEESRHVERLVALDLVPPPTAGKKTRFAELDLTRLDAAGRAADILRAEGVSVLVHLAFASKPSHAEAWFHEVEGVGTMHALTAARAAKVRKVVVTSSTLLYGAHPSNPNFLTERHPLRARKSQFFTDKIAAEAAAKELGAEGATLVTVLRTAPILGPTVDNLVTRYLSQPVVPTLMGFDPLWQLVHEVDALAAYKLAILRDVPGVFNVAGDGVLPLSTIIKLAGRVAVPLPGPLVARALGALWTFHMGFAPPVLLDYLRFVCVADAVMARERMGFVPTYSTREAVLDFAGVQRLREARLLHDEGLSRGGAR